MPRRRKPLRDDLDDEADDAPPARVRRVRQRWRFILFLIALAILVAAAPSIVAKTPLRNLVLSSSLPSSAGRLSAADAAFSWTGGQGLAGVALVDANGSPLFSADLVTSSRSLIGFLSNRDNLGKITVTRPVVRLDSQGGTSNIEQLLKRIAEAAHESQPGAPHDPSSPKTVEIEIVEGVVLGRDLATGQHWRIDSLSLTAKPLEPTGEWDVTAEGVMTLAAIPPAATTTAAGQRPAGAAPTSAASTGGTQAGHFKLHVHPEAATSSEPRGSAPRSRQHLELVADRLPLAPLEPWLARLVPAARLTGQASADLQVTWLPIKAPGSAGGQPASPSLSSRASPGGAGGFNVTIAGDLNGKNIRFTSAALSGDQLELPTAEISLDATLADRQLTARNCSITSDWFQSELNGVFHLAELAALSHKSLPTSDASITARADLPRLARMLPNTLALREGVRIDAGSIEITARSAVEAGQRHWALAAALQDLLGSSGAQPIRWTSPIELVVDAADSPAGPQLQKAIFRSTFGSANVDGAAGGLEGTVQFNLAELANQVGQFKDLSAWKLAGTGAGQFSLRDTGENRFAASADLTLNQIDVQRDGKLVWRDPQVRLELAAAGARNRFTPTRFDTALLTMRGPSDTLSAELLEPIDRTDFNQSWFIRLTGNGSLELWAGRVRPWVAGVPEQLAGQSTITAKLRVRDGLLHVVESQLDVQNLRAQVGSTVIEEQQLKAGGDFRWARADRSLDSNDLQFTSSTIAARARGVSVKLAEVGPPTARGEVAFRGDLERLSSWGIVFGAAQEGLRPRGQAVGRLVLASDASRASATLSATAEPFQLINSVDGALAWNEPRLELGTEATYTSGDDRLQLTNTRVVGKTIQLSGAGVVEQFRTEGAVRGDVNLTYDAAELAKLLTTYLGPGIQIHGANTARIHATGALYPPPSNGGARGGIINAAKVSTLASTETTWNAGPNVAQSTSGAGGFNSANAQPSSLPSPATSLPTHWSRRWQLDVDTALASANLYGLPIGAAQVASDVRDGQIHFAPLSLAVGQGGRISLQPRVTLDPQPQLLELAPGQLISNVAISAEVSERMLKYAAPIVAGATRTEGAFSFFLENAQIPLRHPKQGRLAGRLTIHNLAVTPGPMIQSIAALVRQIETFGKGAQGGGQGLGLGLLDSLVQPNQSAQPLKGVTMTERAIDIQIVDGRVHHRNLEFLIDDVPVRSSGSVGFDETIALMIEVPIQQKWVGSKPALQPLVGQLIQIPVSGTFDRPQIDERAIANFLGQAAQAAAGGLLGDELNKALDKLFKPR
jgi:hypothetical protein